MPYRACGSLGSLLVALLVLWVCGPAYGYAFQYRVNVPHPDEDYLAFTSETVSVDLYLDAEPGLNRFAVGVLWDDALYEYDRGLSTGPSYILYDPGAGMAAAAYLFASPSSFAEWPNPPPGRGQTNIVFLSSGGLRLPASASGQDIWIATLVFHAAEAVREFDSFDVSLEVGGTVVFVGGTLSELETLDPTDVPITRIPEPVTAVLLSAAIACVALFGLRRV